MIVVSEEEYLAHYGILRKSGRYPWGSGETQSDINRSFLDAVDHLRKQGLSEVEIARGLGIVDKQGKPNTTQLRAAKSIARNQLQQEKINQAQRLSDKGLSNIAIGQRMSLNESSVRALLAPGAKDRADILTSTANMLKDNVEANKYVDVGAGNENRIGVSATRLKTAVAMLQEEGYTVHYLKVQQLGTGHETRLKVLAKPDTTYSEVYKNRGDIKIVNSNSEDYGRTYNTNLGIKPPLPIDSKRIGINYAEDGGAKADGVIYIRPGAKDLDLGESRYAQVRIAVDGTHYLKGMAMYKDDLPKGVDVVFNTNKSDTGNKLDAMKSLKDDPDNPFGAVIKPGGQKGAINVVNEEGDWDTWSKSLSSQVLSKQSPDLAKTQLNMTYERKRNDLDSITKLTNPAVKRKLLESFADDADSSAVHMKAAALPRQASRVILPMNSMKEDEIYSPSHNNGERVALIRYPHAGTFEIPELTVNNRNPEAKAAFKVAAQDAVGIHHSVAEHLSGADFDGDTVLVIPNDRVAIKSSPALADLKGFDPKSSFPPYDGMRTIDGGTYHASTKEVTYEGKKSSSKQHEMGNVTNLIADMTIHGASSDELARAVKHSMVVIDSEKHVLDYKASAKQNGIAQLKKKYQGGSNRGASTLITKATSEQRVPQRKPRPASEGGPVDKTTGKRVYVETGNTYDRNGKTVTNTTKSTKLAETDDANTLSSGTPIEKVYADHSNKLKALANEARKEAVNLPSVKVSPSAKEVYGSQVKSLDAKLNVAFKNKPLERQAQLIASTVVSAKRSANPEMDGDTLKKIKGQALAEARNRTGAKKQEVEITPEEWNAIQAGAVSGKKMKDILDNTDVENVRKLATPREDLLMTPTKNARAQSMINSGYTQAEVAQALGVSLTTLKTSLKGGG